MRERNMYTFMSRLKYLEVTSREGVIWGDTVIIPIYKSWI